MKTVLITGANRGIGLEHARCFAARGVHVFTTTRSPQESTALAALADEYRGNVTILPYDATDTDSVHLLKDAIGKKPIDLLLANAGGMGGFRQTFGSLDIDDILQLVRLNALAPLKLAEALADNVARSTRRLIVFQSSLMGSIGDNSSGGFYAYRVSKAALNMIAKNVSNELRSREVVVVAMHPGWVRTRMGGQSAPLTVEQSVAGQQRLLDRLTLADSGRFFNYDEKELPW